MSQHDAAPTGDLRALASRLRDLARIVPLSGHADLVKSADTIEALAVAQPAESPEDAAEHFIQAAIDSSPDPLRRLSEWLSTVLDDDDWKTADRLITGAAVSLASAQPAAVAGDALREVGTPDEILGLADQLEEARAGVAHWADPALQSAVKSLRSLAALVAPQVDAALERAAEDDDEDGPRLSLTDAEAAAIAAVEAFVDAADYNVTCWDAQCEEGVPASAEAIFDRAKIARDALKSAIHALPPTADTVASGREGDRQ